jgi:copper oxidase (laccase) domain-containing protein
MKTKIYLNKQNLIAGMTLKDENEPENNNMALHACLNPNHILANRRKLAAYLHCQPNDLVCANQTHSSNFHCVTLTDKGRGAYNIDTAIQIPMLSIPMSRTYYYAVLRPIAYL